MRSASVEVRVNDEEFLVEATGDGEVRIAGRESALRVTPLDDLGCYLVDDGNRRWRVTVTGGGERRAAFVDGEVYDLQVDPAGSRAAKGAGRKAHAESLTVPMPAKVVSVLVAEGQAVRRGQVVVTLEAMKMQLPLRAPRDGTVRSLACREGDLVQPGVSLLEIA